MNFHFQSYLYICSISILLIIPECGEENNYPDNGCTEIGCSDGFALIIQPSDSLFQEGIYDVSLFNDGIGTSTCFFRVSNDSTECPSGHCVIEENCNAVYMVGYPFPDRVGISYPIIRGPITVTIKRDNVTIITTNFNPEYEFIQPNGPGCPPICEVGQKIIIIE
jgi:hypothetical protein